MKSKTVKLSLYHQLQSILILSIFNTFLGKSHRCDMFNSEGLVYLTIHVDILLLHISSTGICTYLYTYSYTYLQWSFDIFVTHNNHYHNIIVY